MFFCSFHLENLVSISIVSVSIIYKYILLFDEFICCSSSYTLFFLSGLFIVYQTKKKVEMQGRRKTCAQKANTTQRRSSGDRKLALQQDVYSYSSINHV